jgi:hypothetical protein
MGKEVINEASKWCCPLLGQPLPNGRFKLLHEFGFAVCTLPGHKHPLILSSS